jgi:hypothetical protein
LSGHWSAPATAWEQANMAQVLTCKLLACLLACRGHQQPNHKAISCWLLGDPYLMHKSINLVRSAPPLSHAQINKFSLDLPQVGLHLRSGQRESGTKKNHILLYSSDS